MNNELFAELKKYREHSNKTTIKKMLRNPNLSNIFQKLSITELDVIALIADTNPKISDLLPHVNMTQGAVSKLVNRLVKNSFVEKYHKENNQKDTYLRLTALGKQAEKAHQQFHVELNKQLNQAVKNFSEKEIETATKVLKQINKVRDTLD